jgi:hypothetical protein
MSFRGITRAQVGQHAGLLLIVVASVALAGVAVIAVARNSVDSSGRAVTQEQTNQASDIGGTSFNWKDPIRDGSITVSSVEEAKRDAAFTPVTNSTLGTPTILESDPEIVPDAAARSVAFGYPKSEYGLFWIVESEGGTKSNDWFLSLPDQCAQTKTCEGTWSTVDVGSGQQALLITGGETATALTFVTGGVRYDVYGPPETLTASGATAVGTALEEAIAKAG